ncbi:hypothetical protein [Oribacterium sp. FC2011]|uniref:hypothetical protein n=1 Tax=Oribacterium sp. FC2011 TaxID=1408311 RepID=UPI0004E12550|nr:hypothetical protein [Oribacterium sp. FC2011]
MKNKTLLLTMIAAASAMLALSGCSVERKSTSEVNFSVNTDGNSKEYSFKAENNNGVITTEKSVTEETAAATEAPEESTEAAEESTEAPEESTEAAEETENEDFLNAIYYVDDTISEAWNDEGCAHKITYDPDEIYIHVWREGITTIDDIDVDPFRDETIPAWLDIVNDCREELNKRGYSDVELCLQFITDDPENELVFLTIEGGEVIYFIGDEA